MTVRTAILRRAAILAAGTLCAAAAHAQAPVQTQGGVLANQAGMTLYTFDNDSAGKSVCNGGCAKNWPPLAAAADAKPQGDYSIVTRDDGSRQWAYQGKPLLERLGGWLGRGMAFRGRPVIAYHKSMPYFAALFGLQVAGYMEPKPGIPPSARHVHDLLALMEAQQVRVVIAHDYTDPRPVEQLVERTGAKALVLPLEPGGAAAPDYFALVDLWVDRLAQAFLGGSAPVVRPVYAAPDSRRLPGHPVFLARRIWSTLADLRGDEGARHVLSRHPEWVLEVLVGGEAPEDIDTWDDYRRTVDVTRAIGH